MKRKTTALILASLITVLMLTNCASQPTAATSSMESSQESSSDVSSAVSSETSSEESSEQGSSEPTQLEPPSSKAAESSAPTSSKAVSSAPPKAQSSDAAKPTSSKETTSQPAPLSSQASVSSQAPVQESSKPASSEPPAPISSDAPPQPSSEATGYAEDERPMTEAEVDALIQEAHAYAAGKGMTLKESYSVSGGNGYDPPAFSDFGYDSCKYYVYANIDAVYDGAVNSNRYNEGNYIYYNIEIGQLDGMPGYVVYVLY